MKKFLRGFLFAFNGFAYALKSQVNMRFHLFSACLTVTFAAILKLSIPEWCIVLLCIGFVMASELINTSIEKLVDLTATGKNEISGLAKDLAAAAVLVTSIVSAIIGLLIFVPKIIAIISP